MTASSNSLPETAFTVSDRMTPVKKCDPMLVGSLRMKSGFLPAYHMNKNLWISIVLEGLENDGMIKNLIDWSYQVTAARKKEMEID